MSWMIIGFGKGLLVLWAIIVKHRYSCLSPYAFIISKKRWKSFCRFFLFPSNYTNSFRFTCFSSNDVSCQRLSKELICSALTSSYTRNIFSSLRRECITNPYHITGFYPFLPFWFKNVIIFYEKLSKNSNLCC